MYDKLNCSKNDTLACESAKTCSGGLVSTVGDEGLKTF